MLNLDLTPKYYTNYLGTAREAIMNFELFSVIFSAIATEAFIVAIPTVLLSFGAYFVSWKVHQPLYPILALPLFFLFTPLVADAFDRKSYSFDQCFHQAVILFLFTTWCFSTWVGAQLALYVITFEESFE